MEGGKEGMSDQTKLMDGWTERQTNGWMDEWMDKWSDRMSYSERAGSVELLCRKQIDERMDGWIDGRFGWGDRGLNEGTAI
eukprot:scaffold104507_cov28-Prasinocladus_malaysianus.AAC.1